MAVSDNMIDLPRDQWDGYVTNVIQNTMKYPYENLSLEASSLERRALALIEIAAYLDARGGNGTGDHGHHEAMKQASRARKAVRKALGYTWP